jgi:hypothetical protein
MLPEIATAQELDEFLDARVDAVHQIELRQ